MMYSNLDESVNVVLTCLLIYLHFDCVVPRRLQPCWGPDCHYRHRLKRLTQRSVGDPDIYSEESMVGMPSPSSQCAYPCQCNDSGNRLLCKAGVDRVKDGCDCCYMCARQQGDLCDLRFKCDENKGLYCDMEHDQKPGGICRAKSATPCEVNGETYKDGDEFSPDCRRLCTCQNGMYGCTSLCPHEDMPPSRYHCENARLISIEGACCKQWICSSPQDHSYNPMERPQQHGPHMECITETTAWSACSVTCGMGVSLRVTNDNQNCQPVQQRRLCMVRPCGDSEQDVPEEDGRCKTTWRPAEQERFTYDGCTSIKDYRPKYCSTCKKKRCCWPDVDKTIALEFECSENHITVHNFAWIKSCFCAENCQ